MSIGHEIDARQSLIERLASGESFVVAFGGQGSPWLESLAEAVADANLDGSMADLLTSVNTAIEPIADELTQGLPYGFTPIEWLKNAPHQSVLQSASVSVPGIALAQLMEVESLAKQGLDLREIRPAAIIGHSQGIVPAAMYPEFTECPGADEARHAPLTPQQVLITALLIGAYGEQEGRRQGLGSLGSDVSPMMSVRGVDPAEVADALSDFIARFPSQPKTLPVLAIRNGRRASIISGPAHMLLDFQRYCASITEQQAAQRKRKERGGSIFEPTFDKLALSMGAHNPGMEGAIARIENALGRLETFDADHITTAVALARSVLCVPFDWVHTVDTVIAQTGARWILDFGPGDPISRITAPIVAGLGVGIVPVCTRKGARTLFSRGSMPTVERPWSDFAPRLIELPDGTKGIETAFTRLTGRSPILLAGMTPTTVDPAIVAAAANAGHWAELAGGGQVTEEIFNQNLTRLNELLEPGRQAQFNSLFLDPYLWKLQVGGKRLVQRARAAGAALDGVVITAGIPELSEAVDIVDDLTQSGIDYVVFKPGTVDQIRQVIAIAREMPLRPIIVHVEGGKAGGHHSWEDLDDLLLATYPKLRETSNIVLCVGGGIGTPEQATTYLTGTWAQRYGYPAMPVDGILIGTAAMATLEATTSPDVKRLLVETAGSSNWIAAGHADSGMASGRSQLGADIHEIDNSASRCGRLLDEVAGDADAVKSRRDEIIAALNKTAKPYFGDLDTMTYEQWVTRFVQLMWGPTGNADHDATTAWLDNTWRDRFISLVQHIEGRLNPQDRGIIDSIFDDETLADRPYDAISSLRNRYPDLGDVIVHPADKDFFVELCRIPGKPVTFVPVLDKDVRRWWRSDSLWQAHDARYTADQVCIIPGPAAISGIDRCDEPVGELLSRFEAHTVADVAQRGGAAERVASRRRDFAIEGEPAISAVIDAPTVVWSGRFTTNPVAALGDIDAWTATGKGIATNRNNNAVLTATDGTVTLAVPVAGTTMNLTFTVPSSTATGAAPEITADAAASAMRTLLEVNTGGTHVNVIDGVARTTKEFPIHKIADHAGVTASGLPSTLTPNLTTQQLGLGSPDALVGISWPAVFAVINEAEFNGQPLVEGMLNLVHMDHAVELASPLHGETMPITVTARITDISDTDLGRIVTVAVDLTSGHKAIATLTERFAIRGRTGNADLPDPQRAGGSVSAEARDTERKTLRQAVVTAPTDMRAFAGVSGDHNPIHTDPTAARLAGLPTTIVHGMWLSAVAQHVATSIKHDDTVSPRRIVGWTTQFVGMVLPKDTIDIRVDRVGVDNGAELINVTARKDGDLVMSASGKLAPPKTVYAFPGQGIQHQGMGLDARNSSKAAREIWERADKHTLNALGFSIVDVVKNNPKTIWANGTQFEHPDGVLHLTQFTQVAMATLASAQLAQLREAGAYIDDNITCGHSVGEYNALAAFGVLPLESVISVVYRRGSAMHDLVPRDAEGRSNYRMAAIRPSQFDLNDEDVPAFIDDIATRTGEFIEIVNLNLRGSQYAIAGTIKGLTALEQEVERRRALVDGRGCFIYVPGIDLPFHSTVLRDGVEEFRGSLEELIPQDVDAEILIGKYIPNLVPRLFTLDRWFVEEIADTVPSQPLREILNDYDTARSDPRALARTILIELLAWQFASPVRWIETQDLLFTPVEAGGAGAEQFIEVGVRSMPTLAGLAKKTLELEQFAGAKVRVLNVERDADAVRGTDGDPEDSPAVVEDDTITAQSESPNDAVATAPTEITPSVAPATSPAAPAAAPAGGPRPDDLVFGAADATKAMIAMWTKIRPDQLGSADSIEVLTDGVSSRRNQLLLDLGSELSLGAIDGAAEATMDTLAVTIDKVARTYKPFGPVLSDALGDQVRKLVGPLGKRPNYIGEYLTDTWQLGDGWVKHVTVAVVLGIRDGESLRGGPLGGLASGAITTADALDALIDGAVAEVAAAHNVSVGKPSVGGAAGDSVSVDSETLAKLTEHISGPDGALASAARVVLRKLGLENQPSVGETDTFDAELAQLVEQELGSDWARIVSPAFDARKAVLLDDRFASSRADLVRIWNGESIGADRFVGTGSATAAQASWWAEKAKNSKPELAMTYRMIAEAAEQDISGANSADVAVVTGASNGSIAAAVVGRLLSEGATVIATTSNLDGKRLAFFKQLYRDNARFGAALWVLPANMASYSDIDALVKWVGEKQSESFGAFTQVLKPALTPTLLFPFAAPRVSGDMTEAGAHTENQMRILLWGVERLIVGLGALGDERHALGRLHVVLPGSPNRGLFGGDGAYGEAKAAFDAILARWKAESSWPGNVSLTQAIIGWVAGTGLMGHNDGLVEAVEAQGVRTWTPTEMAEQLTALTSADTRAAAAEAPVTVDLTGGLDSSLDISALMDAAQSSPSQTGSDAAPAHGADGRIPALPSPARNKVAGEGVNWGQVNLDPSDMVVVVGAGEVGPFGGSRTRFEMETTGELSAAGVLELAWVTGLVSYENDPKPGWYDTETNELVPEADIADRYHDIVVERTGIRSFDDDGDFVDGTAPLMASVFLDEDLTFNVSSKDQALLFVHADPANTEIASIGGGEWKVTRKAGTEIRVPRRFTMTRTVGGQIPTGFDPTHWGISADMASSVDRLALWNIVATVDAFISSGFTPAELMRWVHPSMVANTQGTGIGGMTSMRTMFVNNLLGESKANDILQESLPNVIAAHVVQSYIGSYGPMVHPVAACATAAVSVEQGFDMIRLGKADFVVAGGYDDLSIDGVRGFADMSATAETQVMRDKGIDDSRFSRPNDRRRAGFVEAHGGGTILLARGDIAAQMGLPVLGVVAWAQSFGDGVHTSIPAPGLGATAVVRGGRNSAFARALSQLGVTGDDIAVVSKHDTSTLANDPNEAGLHERIAAELGRSKGNPLFVVSQKSMTGHSKGGAAAFQLIGLCQVLASGVVPGNRSLDCVDPVMEKYEHLVWPTDSIDLSSIGLKVGVLTSLGFGHVSGLVAIAHPAAFLAALGDDREKYIEVAGQRAAAGERRRIAGMMKAAPLFERPEDRRFGDVGYEEESQLEMAMLVDPDARLSAANSYEA